MLNPKDFEKNSPFKSEMNLLLEISNLAYKNWEIYWTDFFPSYIYEVLLKELSNLSDISYYAYGGYKNADRAKIACFRKSIEPDEKKDLIPSFSAKGVHLIGNFLFDNASIDDFRDFLIKNGIKKNMIGDIWTLGERGAQGIIDINEEVQKHNKYFLRDIEVKINMIDLKELKLPFERVEKLFTTVEASTRLDAIASAGFRISRNKIVEKLKNGFLLLNGLKVNKSTIYLKVGDKIKLENKGTVEILEIEETKRARWKIKLLKK